MQRGRAGHPRSDVEPAAGLSSLEPGKYIRIQRLNDRLSYVAHIDQGPRSVTYWGELRVVLGR